MTTDSASFARNDAPPAATRDRAFFAPVFASLPGPRRIPAPVRNRIAALRAAGWSYWKIGRLLDAEQVPTARGGRRWHQGTVKQALRAGERSNAVNQPLRTRG